MQVHWIRIAERKRQALGAQLDQSAQDLATSLLQNNAIGQLSHGQTHQLQGLYVTIEYTFRGQTIQIEDVYQNRS